MNEFTNDYVEFENGELCLVRCMRCGRTVARIEEYPSEKFKDKLVRQLMKYNIWRQKRIEMTDGTIADIILCVDCFPKETDAHANAITDQIRKAWKKESKEKGRDDNDRIAIDKQSKNVRVITRREKEIINARKLH